MISMIYRLDYEIDWIALSFKYLDIYSYETKVEAVAGIILVRDTFNPLHRAKIPSFCTISLNSAINPLLLLLLLMFIDVNELFPITYNFICIEGKL